MVPTPWEVRQAAAHVVVADLGAPLLEEEDARHLGSVLRLRPGEAVSVTDGMGGYVMCRFGAGGVLEPVGPVVRLPPAVPWVTVGVTPVKGDRTEWAVQKLVEVGVDRIVILETDRSVVTWSGDRAAGHLEKLRKVVRQAVMQSRRCWLPTVSGVVPAGVAPAGVAVGPAAPVGVGPAGVAPAGVAPAGVAPAGVDPTGVALADPDGGPPSLATPTVLIGPEGGWSDGELSSGLPLVTLGPGVMRAETAAVAAGVLLVGLRSGLIGPIAPTPM